jgi:hypothetical protein
MNKSTKILTVNAEAQAAHSKGKKYKKTHETHKFLFLNDIKNRFDQER